MRKINLIIIHCLATKEGRDFHIQDVRRWHVNERGFKDVGYHYLITLDGTIEKGRDESVVGAHAAGYNAHSIGIAYCGGLDENGKPKDTRTLAQKASMYKLLVDLKKKYPDAKIIGHNEVSSKACPAFSVQDDYGGFNH